MAGTGLSVYRGDSKSLRVDVALPDGSSYDLTGMRLVMTVREGLDDTDKVVLQKVASMDAPGSATFNLTPQDTELEPAQYPYDIELSTVDRAFVATLVVGTFTVQQDFTRVVS